MTRKTLSAALITLGFATLSAQAQTPAARPPAAGTVRPAAAAAATTAVPAVPTNAMIAIVYTEGFSAAQGGITRLTNAAQTLEREFEPRRKELETIQQNLQKIATQVSTTQAVAKPEEIQRLREQAETMQLELTRKGQDAQRAYEKRAGEVLAPIQTTINQALVEYARGRGFNMIFNATAMDGQVIPLTNTMDITREFIADFNRNNPATAAAATTPARR